VVQFLPAAYDVKDDAGRRGGTGERSLDDGTAVDGIGEGVGMTDKPDRKQTTVKSVVLSFVCVVAAIYLPYLLMLGKASEAPLFAWAPIFMPTVIVSAFTGLIPAPYGAKLALIAIVPALAYWGRRDGARLAIIAVATLFVSCIFSLLRAAFHT
jgi:hypothetical protein